VPTVWLAEGLLPYLPEEGATGLLKRMAALSHANSAFAADAVSK
jgi:O-methyltransferase involved in polyketide biosynthesis